MEPTERVRVKICCIANHGEAQLAVRYGASAIGLVSAMPSGPGPIPETDIAQIASRTPPGVTPFLLTCLQEAEALVAQQRRCGVGVLQLVDSVAPKVYIYLREAVPGIRLVQVIHVTGEESVAEAAEAAQFVDAILLDSGNPRLAVKELGGTGRRHDWSLSRRIREQVDVPLYLAGGLNADNVVEAIQTVQPFGVDICSGVREEGRLSEAKLAAFMRSVAPIRGM